MDRGGPTSRFPDRPRISAPNRSGILETRSSAYVVEPGHDAWVVGDEPYCTDEFESGSAEHFAKA